MIRRRDVTSTEVPHSFEEIFINFVMIGKSHLRSASTKLRARRASISFDPRTLCLRALSFAQDALAGIERVGIRAGPIGIYRELVEQTVLINPGLHEQAVWRFSERARPLGDLVTRRVLLP